MRILVLALLLLGCGGTRRFVECNDTASCREQQAERARAFSNAVDEERIPSGLVLEQVAESVLLSRDDGRLFVLDPELVELDLATGEERWRAAGVSGDRLWLVGRSIAVGRREGALTANVTFVDLGPNRTITRCEFPVPAPNEANRISLHVFGGEGGPSVYWSSAWTYQGGVPPGLEQQARARRSRACGVVKVELPACAIEPLPLDRFVWEPPEGRRWRPGDPGYCDSISPQRDLPLAAGSAAPAFKNPASSRGLSLAVTESEPMEMTRFCGRVVHVALEARDEKGTRVWSHPLEERRYFCPPP